MLFKSTCSLRNHAGIRLIRKYSGSPEANPVKIQTSILREKICPIKPDFDAVIVRTAKKQKPIVANIARLLKNAATRRRFAVPMQNAV
ncbi:hypothetical protein [Neisseria gonorrhoeae]|uniref:hypothetical protein n=1 Tax=Neisseria gonorrhoeae TaxID=485 RepID=UPI0003026A12|nr:hypothetical protein [Neisseria gonorrhoeae]